jgi:catechol 2,3-dioxygenase-like lactoylglutathione lyase family enzyme
MTTTIETPPAPTPFDRPAVDEPGEPVVFGQYNGFEVYPMPAFATLEVPDLDAAIAWYEAALGFRPMLVHRGPEERAVFSHLRRAKYQDLLVVPGPGAPEGSTGITITLRADGDPAALAAKARAVAPVGRVTVEGPIDTPWNTTDVRVTDPGGHRLVLTAPNRRATPEARARLQVMLAGGRR